MWDDSSTRKKTPSGDAGEQLLRVGELIAGKYRVERVLGVGGMGVVVAVTHLQLGEVYALKFLRGAAASDTGNVERFLREARAAVRIKSEHIVRVSDVGQLPNGSPFIAMEYLNGRDLAQVLQDNGPLPAHDAVSYVVQACAGIDEAHANGIVHRDLKPSNLFLTTRSDGSPLIKVLDFGISKVSLDGGSSSLTETHEVFGSPAYMPPEQIRSAKRADVRSDVWALGIILHELLTGALPFEGETAAALLAAISVDQPRSARASRPDLSEGLDAIIRRCLEKSPEARFASVAELAAALTPFANADSATLAARIVRRASMMPPANTAPAAVASPSSPAAFATTERRLSTQPAGRVRMLGGVAALAVTVVGLLGGSAIYMRRGTERQANELQLPDSTSPASPALSTEAPSAVTTAASTPPGPSTEVPPALASATAALAPTTPPALSASAVSARPSAARPQRPTAPRPSAQPTAPTSTKSEPNGPTDTSH